MGPWSRAGVALSFLPGIGLFRFFSWDRRIPLRAPRHPARGYPGRPGPLDPARLGPFRMNLALPASSRLGDFIEHNLESILQEWEEFARSLAPMAGLDKTALRDHAEEMLTCVARDMREPQSEGERSAKSKGLAPPDAGLDQAAESHAKARMGDDFTVDQLVAEFRAIRASVLRRWAAHGANDNESVEEVTRFNEAIDQALSTSVGRYSARREEARAIILGVLAHDLRNPLHGISMGMHYLLRSDSTNVVSNKVAARALRNVERMDELIRALLDFTLARMGNGLPVKPEPVQLGTLCSQVVEEMESSHPGRVVRWTSSGDLDGEWDPGRLSQLLVNLVSNALHHGDADGEVRVTLGGTEHEVWMDVHNSGPVLSEASRRRLFQPLNRPQAESGGAGEAQSSGLGLGLYIAAQIASAHRGTLGVSSTVADGTTFSVRLPRHAVAR